MKSTTTISEEQRQQAFLACDNKDWVRHISVLRKLARYNDPEAQFRLGKLYAGFDDSAAKYLAYYWLRSAVHHSKDKLLLEALLLFLTNHVYSRNENRIWGGDYVALLGEVNSLLVLQAWFIEFLLRVGVDLGDRVNFSRLSEQELFRIHPFSKEERGLYDNTVGKFISSSETMRCGICSNGKIKSECSVCSGSGEFDESICPSCLGSGKDSILCHRCFGKGTFRNGSPFHKIDHFPLIMRQLVDRFVQTPYPYYLFSPGPYPKQLLPISKSLPYAYYLDSEHGGARVTFDGEIIPGADPREFTVLRFESGVASLFARDTEKIFYRGTPIAGAHADTFELVHQSHPFREEPKYWPVHWESFAKDQNRSYFREKAIPQKLSGVKNLRSEGGTSGDGFVSNDSGDVWFHGILVENAHGPSFQILEYKGDFYPQEAFIAQDHNRVFVYRRKPKPEICVVRGAIGGSVYVSERCWFSDKKHVFLRSPNVDLLKYNYGSEPLKVIIVKHADPKNFRSRGKDYYSDDRYIFYQEKKIISGASFDSFRLMKSERDRRCLATRYAKLGGQIMDWKGRDFLKTNIKDGIAVDAHCHKYVYREGKRIGKILF